MTKRRLVLHEVGPRDGLQVEGRTVPTATKRDWIERILAAGVDVVQVGSFVHPEKVPQMADTDALFRELAGRPVAGKGVLSGLVLNEKGLDRALACGVSLVCMGVSASDTHSRKNVGLDTAEATRRIVAMAKRAVEAGRAVQVSVQSAFGCGFEGPVPEERVLSIVREYLGAGLTRISLADTAGHAWPDQVERLYGRLLALAPDAEPACHFHDTYGLGMANVWAAMRAGAVSFESSFGGLGGCPFTKVAAGNVATEDLVHGWQRSGIRTDVDLAGLVAVARSVAAFFVREMPGRVYKTGPVAAAPKKAEVLGVTKRALEGIRVVDLTNVLSGPYATLHLALLGAEVIKVENPADGDLARKLGNVPKLNKELMGTSFLAQNANKKSITLNLKKKEARRSS